MADKIKFGKSSGFFDSFDRRPGVIKKNMHYCPGCGHGILHKLIAEAIVDLDIQKKMVIVAPVGCSVFAYYYFDAYGISVPHGRAPSVATGIIRAEPDNFVISYQGDGDLGAIGFNNFIQAANRGENMTVCFVNNAIYGMTSGQMAPTTLVGQKTTTSPYGRDVDNEGFPLKVAEMVAELTSPIYVERVALRSPTNIRKARKALRKGLGYMKEKKGFSLIEFLAGCPVNFKKTTKETDEFIENEMIPYFPLGCFKDIASERKSIVRKTPIHDTQIVKETLFRQYQSSENHKTELRKDLRIKCAGTGGQGVLSLGMMFASIAQTRSLNVSWLPSYGPEMRGGTANCSVVLSNNFIGTPIVNHPNILITMNQPSMDKFIDDVDVNGVVIYDSVYIKPANRNDVRFLSVPASEIAKNLGNIKCANSALLGAFNAVLSTNEKDEYESAFEEAIKVTFILKPELIDINIKAFNLGKKSVKQL